MGAIGARGGTGISGARVVRAAGLTRDGDGCPGGEPTPSGWAAADAPAGPNGARTTGRCGTDNRAGGTGGGGGGSMRPLPPLGTAAGVLVPAVRPDEARLAGGWRWLGTPRASGWAARASSRCSWVRTAAG